ncbi:MAG: hypothetical protein ABIK45_00020 [Pseudomonadota bacterium]
MDNARHLREDPELIEISCPLCGGRTPNLPMERNIRDLNKGFDYLSESGGHFDINRCAAYSSPVFAEGTPDAMLAKAGLNPVKRMKSLTTYSLDHLARNGIVNQKARDVALRCLSALGIGNLHLSFPFGNIEAIATKQARPDRKMHHVPHIHQPRHQ